MGNEAAQDREQTQDQDQLAEQTSKQSIDFQSAKPEQPRQRLDPNAKVGKIIQDQVDAAHKIRQKLTEGQVLNHETDPSIPALTVDNTNTQKKEVTGKEVAPNQSRQAVDAVNLNGQPQPGQTAEATKKGKKDQAIDASKQPAKQGQNETGLADTDTSNVASRQDENGNKE